MTVLPSPVPHPLDHCPWDLPGWAYEALEWVVGFQWPDGDEAETWDAADRWYRLAAVLAGPRDEAAEAAGQILTGYGGTGVTVDAFRAAWDGLAADRDAPLNALITISHELGAMIEECGCDIEGAKLEAWIELGIFVIELIGMAVAVALTLGAASPAAGGLIAATRIAIQQIFRRLVEQLGRKAIRKSLTEAATRLTTRSGLLELGRGALREGAGEAAEEFATNGGIQLHQTSTGRRDGIDAGELGMSTLGGFAGGFSAHVGRGGDGGGGVLRGAGGEVLGEFGAAAVQGRLPDLEGLAKSASSGVTGAAVQSVQAKVAGLQFPSVLPDGDGPGSLSGGDTSSSVSSSVDTLPPVMSSSVDTSPRVTPSGDAFPRVTSTGDAFPRVTSTGDASPQVTPSGEASRQVMPSGDAFPQVMSLGDASARVTAFGDATPQAAGSEAMPVGSSSSAADSSFSAPHPESPQPAAEFRPAATDATPVSTSDGGQVEATTGPVGGRQSPAADDVSLSAVATLDPAAVSGAGAHPPSAPAAQVSQATIMAGSSSPGIVTPDAGGFTSAAQATSTQPSAPVAGLAPPTQPSTPATGFAPPIQLSAPAAGLASTTLQATAPVAPTPSSVPSTGLGPPFPAGLAPAAPTGLTSAAMGRATPTDLPGSVMPQPIGSSSAAPASDLPSSRTPTALAPGRGLDTGQPGGARGERPRTHPGVSTGDLWSLVPGKASKAPTDDHGERIRAERQAYADLRRQDTVDWLSGQAKQLRWQARSARRSALAARYVRFEPHAATLHHAEARTYRRQARELAAQATAVRRDPARMAPVRVTDDPLAWHRLNTDPAPVTLGTVGTGDRSLLTGSDHPPSVDRTRQYGRPLGLRPPLTEHQAGLENAVPRDPAGAPIRGADPRRPYFSLLNDGGPAADPARGINCQDCVLSFYDTYVHGRPRVSAPRTFDAYSAGDPARLDGAEAAGTERAELVTSGRFQSLCPDVSDEPPEVAKQRVDRAFADIADQVRAGGHGSFAFIVSSWESGAAHAWAAVNHDGEVLFVDPQLGLVAGTSAPTLYGHHGVPDERNVVAVDALVVDGRGEVMEFVGAPDGQWHVGTKTLPPLPPPSVRHEPTSRTSDIGDASFSSTAIDPARSRPERSPLPLDLLASPSLAPSRFAREPTGAGNVRQESDPASTGNSDARSDKAVPTGGVGAEASASSIPDSDRYDPPGIGYFTDLYAAFDPSAVEREMFDRLPARDRDIIVASRREAEDIANDVQPDIEAALASLPGSDEADRPELVGLEHRTKTEFSLARAYTIAAHTEDVALPTFLRSQKDRVRFSVAVPEADYLPTVTSMLDALRARGYDVGKVVNFWHERGRHNGLNISLRAPSGASFELQFPTPLSYSIGHETHRYYETIRVDEAIPALQVDAFLRMLAINKARHIAAHRPEGAETLGEIKNVHSTFARWFRMDDGVREAYGNWLRQHELSLEDMVARHGLVMEDLFGPA